MVVIKGCKILGGGGRDTISVIRMLNGNNGQGWKTVIAHSLMVVVLSLMVLVQQGTAMDVVPEEGGVDSSIATSHDAMAGGGGTHDGMFTDGSATHGGGAESSSDTVGYDSARDSGGATNGLVHSCIPDDDSGLLLSSDGMQDVGTAIGGAGADNNSVYGSVDNTVDTDTTFFESVSENNMEHSSTLFADCHFTHGGASCSVHDSGGGVFPNCNAVHGGAAGGGATMNDSTNSEVHIACNCTHGCSEGASGMFADCSTSGSGDRGTVTLSNCNAHNTGGAHVDGTECTAIGNNTGTADDHSLSLCNFSDCHGRSGGGDSVRQSSQGLSDTPSSVCNDCSDSVRDEESNVSLCLMTEINNGERGYTSSRSALSPTVYTSDDGGGYPPSTDNAIFIDCYAESRGDSRSSERYNVCCNCFTGCTANTGGVDDNIDNIVSDRIGNTADNNAGVFNEMFFHLQNTDTIQEHNILRTEATFEHEMATHCFENHSNTSTTIATTLDSQMGNSVYELPNIDFNFVCYDDTEEENTNSHQNSVQTSLNAPVNSATNFREMRYAQNNNVLIRNTQRNNRIQDNNKMRRQSHSNQLEKNRSIRQTICENNVGSSYNNEHDKRGTRSENKFDNLNIRTETDTISEQNETNISMNETTQIKVETPVLFIHTDIGETQILTSLSEHIGGSNANRERLEDQRNVEDDVTAPPEVRNGYRSAFVRRYSRENEKSVREIYSLQSSYSRLRNEGNRETGAETERNNRRSAPYFVHHSDMLNSIESNVESHTEEIYENSRIIENLFRQNSIISSSASTRVMHPRVQSAWSAAVNIRKRSAFYNTVLAPALSEDELQNRLITLHHLHIHTRCRYLQEFERNLVALERGNQNSNGSESVRIWIHEYVAFLRLPLEVILITELIMRPAETQESRHYFRTSLAALGSELVLTLMRQNPSILNSTLPDSRIGFVQDTNYDETYRQIFNNFEERDDRLNGGLFAKKSDNVPEKLTQSLKDFAQFAKSIVKIVSNPIIFVKSEQIIDPNEDAGVEKETNSSSRANIQPEEFYAQEPRRQENDNFFRRCEHFFHKLLQRFNCKGL